VTLVHEALYYRSLDEYLTHTVRFVQDGLRRQEPVLVAVPEPRLGLLRTELGPEADGVRLLDMAEVGRNPNRIIPWVLRSFVDEHAPQPVRLIGEPIYEGRSQDELGPCVQHEALINVALARAEARVLCPYDVARLPDVVSDAEHTHPIIIEPDGSRRRGEYLDPAAVVAMYNRPLPEPSTPLSPAVRPDDGEHAVVLERAARRYGAGSTSMLGLPPTSVAFGAGRFHVVTGPSGSGKSTLLRLVSGLDRPTEGRVVTLGNDLATLDRDALARLRAARIGIVDQVRDLVPFLTASENVELGLAIRGVDPDDARPRAIEALEAVGLGEHLDRAPDGLSAGERLRVALARALAAGPDLLILDEPTAALDRAGARAVARLLAGLDGRVTVLATTHDPALIEAASDRLDLVVASGREPVSAAR